MKLFENFNEKLSPIIGKLDSNRYINALKEGMFIAMPIMMIGSVFSLIMNFPVPAFNTFIASVFGDGWVNNILVGYFCTMGLAALLMLLGISRSLAKAYEMNEVFTISASIVAYLLIMPINGDSLSIPGSFGTGQILVTLIVGIVAVEILHFVEKHGWTIKLPKEVPAFVAKSFSSLIPEFILVAIFFTIRCLFTLTPYGDLSSFIMGVIAAPLGILATSVPGIIVLIVISNITYWFGISPGTIGSLFEPFLLMGTAANSEAFVKGIAGTHIFDSAFRDQFTCIGGSGCTLALVIGMVFFAKSKQNKSVGKMSLIPAIFNVNEPVAFGAPIVFNLRLLLPFIIAPTVGILIAYAAMSIGLVPVSNGVVLPFTIPVGIKAFLNYGWQGTVLQLFILVIQIFIYLPFFKAYDKDLLKKEKLSQEEQP